VFHIENKIIDNVTIEQKLCNFTDLRLDFKNNEKRIIFSTHFDEI